MRIIDADKTLQKTDEAFLSYANHDDILRLYSDARLAVINAPTLTLDDIIPHGRWEITPILRTDPDGDWVALEYHCSLCNRLEYRKENYCPNCGAKMIGDNDG